MLTDFNYHVKIVTFSYFSLPIVSLSFTDGVVLVLFSDVRK